MGPLLIGRKQLKFLIVAIDYFMKWVEAKPTTTIIKAKITSFKWKNVVYKFGIPNVIVSDNGKQLDNPKMTTRVPTRKTPFRLTFGTEVVIPTEIGLMNIQVKTYEEQKNHQELNNNLDLIDEVRDEVSKQMEKYRGVMARYYNKKVKLRRFNVGDLVLRKILQAIKDLSQGKLGPT
ncbi:uncharacterized protein LOC142630658 [Castanea sativa]|uniref:uncharacterized protein LOC142630658 n=1 Tax=Castanea sativa TaxID=21020 RepID=UPI003F65299A